MAGNLECWQAFSKAGFMDFQELVATRRTVHNYKPEAVSEDLVVEALRLSLWAPNHKLSFPWVYTWVGPRARVPLADLAVELKGKKEPLSEVKKKAARDNVLNPAHLISLGVRRSEPHRQHEDFATLSCSVQIASLFLWQHGIGTKWSTGGWGVQPKTYEVLGLDPAAVALEGMLMIGVPQMQPPVPERPTLDSFLKRIP